MVMRQSCIAKAYCMAYFTGKVLIDLQKPQYFSTVNNWYTKYTDQTRLHE